MANPSMWKTQRTMRIYFPLAYAKFITLASAHGQVMPHSTQVTNANANILYQLESISFILFLAEL